jgi:hypothetical protein
VKTGTSRVAGVASLIVAGAIAAPSAQESAAVSVDHIRTALERPSALMLTDRKPDFTVHIEKRRPMQDIFDVPPWQLEPLGWRPPAVGFDLLSVVRYVAKSVADAKYAHDLRVARDEVQRAIADYCAAQTDNRAATQICSTSSAIR